LLGCNFIENRPLSLTKANAFYQEDNSLSPSDVSSSDILSSGINLLVEDSTFIGSQTPGTRGGAIFMEGSCLWSYARV